MDGVEDENNEEIQNNRRMVLAVENADFNSKLIKCYPCGERLIVHNRYNSLKFNSSKHILE